MTGDYSAAIQFQEQALAILRQVYGSDEHPDVASILVNLSMVDIVMGDYEAALPLVRQALEIRQRLYKTEDNPDVAYSLGNLGGLYLEMGDHVAAGRCQERALGILRRVHGTDDHPDISRVLIYLGGAHEAGGDYESALQLFQEALEVLRRVHGTDQHPDVAGAMNRLGCLYRDLGDLNTARRALEDAFDAYSATAGVLCDGAESTVFSLARIAVAEGRLGDALNLFGRWWQVSSNSLGQLRRIGSERQLLASLEQIRPNFWVALSFVAMQCPSRREVCRWGADLALCVKGIATEAVMLRRDVALSGRYPELTGSFRHRARLRQQISQESLVGFRMERPETYRRRLVELSKEAEELEREIAAAVPEFEGAEAVFSPDCPRIVNALPDASTLIEYVHFDSFDFHAIIALGQKQWSPARYAAFVLQAAQPENVALVDLGLAEEVDLLIAEFRQQLRRTGDVGRVGYELWKRLLQPLLPAIGDHRRLFISPDGELTRLPFEVLKGDDGQLLLDRYTISYLSAGRDLLKLQTENRPTTGEPLVVADPAFELGASETTTAAGEASRRSPWRELSERGGAWKRLEWTAVEGKAVAQLLRVPPLLQEKALEGAIRASRGPKILHLATHGFFLEDLRMRERKERDFWTWENEGYGVSRVVDSTLGNPMLRSGIVLAGAETWRQGKPLPPEAEDGILTAEDITGLDFCGTELVVLSACDTGLGDIKVGDGVFGLRRAFHLAGAKTLVMSLWEVPDKVTAQLMERFYRNVLSGMGKAEALPNAQLHIKRKYPDPYYWGAFICQGDPGPLRQLPAKN